MTHLRIVALALLTLLPGYANMTQAATTETLRPLQQRWAQIQYDMHDDDARAKAFAALADEIGTALDRSPQDPDLMIWQGIVLSSEAGVRGGLGALKRVKQARKRFEAAIEIDPEALQGSALTSLATLYHQVPGWPIGFGDDDKARGLFEQALQVNPKGIDTHYFYAAFLADEGQREQARQHLQQALKAPPRPGRETADAGRRQEIQQLLEQLQ
ncbi:tetratricopeptide repeat protein [Marinobacterium sp. AK62]|uniref:Tetratricopeptide repeat protein n=1 Tax=Marinobacterium alkalitolerans TaxID=1542925 RepID=A0ABS3Z7L2_9GAMM|nr:tetratricopeptide repeat protein [Marinobacterium alkalitolerans]MBP0047695.1 tetratricopeptide repeat protein [Marinobacterium alkalitolerans]